MLAKCTPSFGVFTMQTNQVGPLQGVQYSVTVVINRSFYVIDYDELGARIALHEHAHMRPQRSNVDICIKNAGRAAGDQSFKLIFRNSVQIAAATITKHRECRREG